jgi:hypothetical protein
MILIHPYTSSSCKSFGFLIFCLTCAWRRAGMAVQINRMGVIDRLSQGASGKSRVKKEAKSWLPQGGLRSLMPQVTLLIRA